MLTVVLHVGGEDAGALAPGAGADAAAELVRQAQEEVRFTRAGTAAGYGQSDSDRP